MIPDTSQLHPESEVRRLRDNIYNYDGALQSDEGWDACKANWMLPESVRWLQEHQPKSHERQIPKGR